MLHDGNPHYDPLRDDCRLMLKDLGGATVKHYYREQNGVENVLAKKVVAMEAPRSLQIFVVPQVYALIQEWADINGTSYTRIVRTNNSDLGRSPNCFTEELD